MTSFFYESDNRFQKFYRYRNTGKGRPGEIDYIHFNHSEFKRLLEEVVKGVKELDSINYDIKADSVYAKYVRLSDIITFINELIKEI